MPSVSRAEIVAALEADNDLLSDQVAYFLDDLQEAVLSFLRGEEQPALDAFRSVCRQVEANVGQLLSDYYQAVDDGLIEED